MDLDELEMRLYKLELAVENLIGNHAQLEAQVSKNSSTLSIILSNTESLDKILKYVVTPLILIIGAIVGVNQVIPT